MNALIVLFALALPTQQTGQSLYSRIVQNPTGQNGYEEYVRAADRALAVDLREAVDAIDVNDGESTRLSRIKDVVDKSNDIARLIEVGNRKPAMYPALMNFETLLPELGTFRTIARALAARAEWQFSQGQPNTAIDTTLQLMAFSEGIASAGPVIHYVVATRAKTYALGVLSKHRGRIALPGAAAIQLYAMLALDRPSSLLASLRIEFEAVIASLDAVIDNPEAVSFLPSDKLEQLKGISSARRALIKSEIVFAMTKTYEARMAMFERPEREWESVAEQSESVAQPTDPIAQWLHDVVLPLNLRMERFEQVRRAQLRLLILHAAIIEYRWTHGQWTYGQLPSSLSELDVPISIIDPLTGEPFKYELVGDDYDLYSEGTPGTGRIDLNWRSSSSSDELMPPSTTMLRRASSSTTSAIRLGTP